MTRPNRRSSSQNHNSIIMMSPDRNRASNLSQRGKRILGNNLFRGGALSLLIQAQSVAIQLLTGVLLARTLGPDDFGTYSFALAAVKLIQVIPSSGLDNVVIRYTAEYRVRQSWALMRGLWKLALLASVAYGLLSAGVTLGAFFLSWLPATAALAPNVLAAAAILMVFSPQITFFGAAIRGVSPGIVGQLPQYAVKPWVYLALLAMMAVIAPQALSAEGAMYAQGAAAFVTTLLGIYWLIKHRPAQITHETSVYEFANWLRPIPAFCLLSGLMLINAQADMLMLGLLGSPYETGIYKVATTGASLVALSLIAANLYIAPRIAAMYSAGELSRLQRLLSLSVRSTFAVALAVASVFWFWGFDIIRIVFGAVYVGAFWPLAILSAGQLCNVGAGSVGLILSMTGHERAAAKMAGIAAVINVAMNLVLIPKFGGVGAAISSTISMLIWNGLMLIQVKHKTGLNASIISIRANC